MGDFLEISVTDAAQMRKVAVKWCVVDATASLVAKAWSTTCIATNCSEGSHGVFPPVVGIWLAISTNCKGNGEFQSHLVDHSWLAHFPAQPWARSPDQLPAMWSTGGLEGVLSTKVLVKPSQLRIDCVMCHQSSPSELPFS